METTTTTNGDTGPVKCKVRNEQVTVGPVCTSYGIKNPSVTVDFYCLSHRKECSSIYIDYL